MALDIQAPNLSGLAGIAGKYTNMNIAPTGALGLEALKQKSQQEEALRRDALAKMQMQQQGQMQLRQQDIQRQQMAQQAAQQQQQGLFQQGSLGIRQQELAAQTGQNQIQNAYNQQQLAQQGALGQQGIDVKKQEMLVDQQKVQMAQLLQEKKETLQEKGAFASYGLMSMNSAKTPQEAQQIWGEISKEAVGKNYLTKEQADQLSQLPISQRMNFMKGTVIATGTAKEYKDVQDQKAGTTGMGNIKVTDANGNTIEYAPPTTAEKGNLEKGITGDASNIRELKEMLGAVPDNFFGAAAMGQTGAYLRELGQSIPGVGSIIEPSKEDKESNKLYYNLQSKVKNLSMNIIRELSGQSYTDKQLEFMNDIVPQIGPKATRSQFEGKAESLLGFMERSKAAKEELLKNGYKLDSPAFKDAYLDKLKNIVAAPKPQYSKEDVEAEMKRRGLK